jgi:membrane protein DedA with SNARE-associated domain
MDSIADFLLTAGTSPIAIVALIVLATFVLEDAAIVGAALLCAMGLIDQNVALLALIFGIFIGDIGLYALGAASRRYGWAKRVTRQPYVAGSGRWLKRRAGRTLVLARFLPGFRLPIYVASGLFDVPLILFAIVTLGAGIVWTIAIFEVVLLLGQTEAGHLKLIAGALAITLLAAGFILPRVAERLRLIPARGGK